MKVAIIGLGRWGKVLLEELKKQVGVKYEGDSKSDLNVIWKDPEVKAVFIATPTPTHFDIASKALEAGKHVFLEKPGTTSSDDLEKLVEKARKKNLKLAIGYEYPHHPVVQKIKEIVGSKKIDFIRLEYQKWGSFKDEIIRNLLCHHISILKFLGVDIGEPKINKVGVVTEADIMATRFGDNVMSIINRVSPVKAHTMLIKKENGNYLWKDDELFEIVGEEMKPIDVIKTSPVSGEIADFLFAIKEDKEPYCSGKFALEIYKIIESVQSSVPR